MIRSQGFKKWWIAGGVALLLIAAFVTLVGFNGNARAAQAAAGEVLILDTTAPGGLTSTIAQKFVLAGKTPVMVNSATWSGMTTAQFADYDAIVMGDPNCYYGGAGDTTPVNAAVANAATWGAAVDGNVIVIGTDELLHQFSGGAQLMEKAAAFVVSDAGKTGAYVSLGCYYHGAAPGTAVPLLDAFSVGGFTTTGVPGCFDSAHIVATHPALSGLTDATLSGWGCSVHEAFDAWPVDFEVLAIALTGSVYNAPDGTVGTPYILARGVQVISDIDLAPETATNYLGETHTVTATVTTDDPAPGAPVVGTTVTFTVIAGPHTGTTGTGVTNASGVATFSYVGTSLGVDTIEATFIDSLGRAQRSNRVSKEWIEAPTPTPTLEPTATPTPAPALGFMTGGGNVTTDSGKAAKRYSHGFEIHCDGSQGNFQYNDHTQKGNFHLESISSVVCSDDPGIDPSNPSADFDTLVLVGAGRWNGVSGATIEATLTDAGEPGKNDYMSVTIKVGSSVVSSASGNLSGGNHQAHED